MKHKPLFRFISILLSAGVFIAAIDKREKSTAPSQAKIEETIFSFAKTYGYIRYFYPGDEVADFNWDRFAWYGADVITRNSDYSIDKQIHNLFSPIVSSLQIEKDAKRISNIYNNKVFDKKNAVYWQHLGDGKERIGYPYMSMRVNRPARKLPESPNDYASIRKILDAKKYQGKKVKLSGKLKAASSFIGRVSLLITVKEFGKDRKIFSTDGQAIKSEIWATHEIIAQLPDSIEQLSIVCEPVLQIGALSFDEFLIETEVDGVLKHTELFDFENINAEVFKKEWRSFGPNQDIALQKDGVNNTVVAFSRTEGNLMTLPPLFAEYPDQHSFLIKSIGSGWHIGFPLVMQLEKNRTIPSADSNHLNKLRESLKQINSEKLGIEHLQTKIANIIILWNRLQHFHPDNPYSTTEWENELRKAIRKSFTDRTLDDHRLTLTKMSQGLKDSHMTFYISALQRTPFYFPFKWQWVEGKLVITKAISSDTLNIKQGDIVEKVNGINADKYWATVKSAVIGATDARKEYKAIEESLAGENGTTLQLDLLSKNGSKSKITVERTLSEFDYNKRLSPIDDLEKYQQIKPGIFYVNLSQIVWDDLKAHLDELSKAKGIIFDLRGYPNWKTIEIVSHFSKDTIKGMTYLTPKVIYPDRTNNPFTSNVGTVYEPRKPFIPAKKIFLTNGKAISYSEDFMQMIEFYKLATIVGDYTAGTTGNINMNYLYGGLSIPWTGMRVLKQDCTQFNGFGVKPDILVKPTIKNIRKGKDDCIEYVMNNIFM